MELFKHVDTVLNRYNFPTMCLKPQQLQCWDELLMGNDVVGVLPTGYGKSLIFQLLPDILPLRSKGRNNIVLVVGPLNSIIEDQMNFLRDIGINCGMLKPVGVNDNTHSSVYKLFHGKDANQSDVVLQSDTENDEEEEVEITISEDMRHGNCLLVFGHPESFLSPGGQKLLRSPVYQKNVVAITVDEAHCVETWKDFRTDFRSLGSLRALFPCAKMLVLTATASVGVLRRLKEVFSMDDAKILSVSPNRANVYIQKSPRLSNHAGAESYRKILIPMAEQLNILKEKYPLTIVYVKLECMKMVYRLFSQIVEDRELGTGLRLFALFHSQTTKEVKSIILSELRKPQSHVRVVFATQALGMGVDTRSVAEVVHITPSSSLTSYFQEIGRAGRDGREAKALLYYNNADIADNRTNVTQEMKDFCRADECLRSFILKYFGFETVTQKRCCSNCHPELVEEVAAVEEKRRYRSPPLPDDIPKMREELLFIVQGFNAQNEGSLFDCPFIEDRVIEDIVENAEFAENSRYFIDSGIWDDDYLSLVFNVVCNYCPEF